MTGIEFLEELRQAIRRWPVTGLEVHTITEGLRAPVFAGDLIGWVGASEDDRQNDGFFYQALYLGDDDEQHAHTITAEEAAELLDDAGRYYESESKVSERGSHRGEEPIPIK